MNESVIIIDINSKIPLYLRFTTSRRDYGVHFTETKDEACIFSSTEAAQNFMKSNEFSLENMKIIPNNP